MIDRRSFVAGALALLAWPHRGRAAGLPSSTTSLLASSPYVYISPLKSDGGESACHGEVWFAWLDGSVVTTTGAGRWKARSVKAGLDRARLWVGDHGRWKKTLGKNEAFRAAPHFDARVKILSDPALLERLLEVYGKKYPDEIERWAGKMRREVASGDRVILRYEPV